ncbi:DUF5808 domain-containing protein [Paenibacillus sp. LHD-117]|uniref:DUF1648 domain-containing protein n=1 Tax=Paenibacillus sp. LHD-117 TaxID=3071412 RepID=UPI0027E01AFB|nr:DUF5808 domain-containing protein [Paenibacillus sp. LHD-117]MDQ6422563.1 DUF5808 domain-containing protein [Paenibacillus sp. LHD-117]
MSINWMLLLSLVIMVPVVLTTTVIPLLTRKIESFGVTIPEEAQNHPVIESLRGKYVWWNGGAGTILTLSLLICSLYISGEKTWGALLVSHVVGYMILSFVIYYKQHQAVKSLKERERWLKDAPQRIIVSTRFRSGKLTQPNYWFIPHILLILATVLVGVIGYDRLPDQIPMKYGLDGEVTRAVAKSYRSVLWPAFVQSFLLVVFVFTNAVIGRSKQVAEPGDPEGSLLRNMKFRQIWSSYLIAFGFMIMATLGLIPVGMLYGWSGNVAAVATIAVVGIMTLASIVLSVKTGQGGSRIKLDKENTAKQYASAADQDRYWKLGQFYYNPDDPSYFVEKRFGIGWTINHARPGVWVIFAILILLIVLLPFILE